MQSNPDSFATTVDSLAGHLLTRTREAVLLVHSSDLVIVDASTAACDLLGIGRSDLQTVALPKILKIDPDDAAHDFWQQLRSFSRSSEEQAVQQATPHWGRVSGNRAARSLNCRIDGGFQSGDAALSVLTLSETLPASFSPTVSGQGCCENDALAGAVCTTADGNQASGACEQLLNDVRAIIWESGAPYAGMLYVSGQLETILGYSPQEWIEDPEAWANSIIEEDRQQATDYCTGRAAAGEDHDFEYRARAVDGRIVWIHDHVHVLTDSDDKPTMLRGVMTDITARKQAEELHTQREADLRLLFENVPVCIHSIDQDQKVDSINPAGVVMVRAKDASEVIGKSYLAFVDPADRSRIESLLQEAFKGLRSDYKFTCLTLQGTRAFKSNFIPIQDPDGVIRRVIGTSEDITDRQKTQDRLRERETQLAHVNRLSTMGEMVAGIAHEVNQPLYSIINFAKAISVKLDQPGPSQIETIRGWNEEIRDAANLAGGIIRRLRRFVSRDPEFTKQVDLHEVTDHAIELIDHELRRARVDVHRDYRATTAMVRVDVVQIQQVIINLLVNAVEAIESKDGKERKIAIRSNLIGNRVLLSVADTGCGLPPGSTQNLFDAFVSTKKDGMGMGLAISSTIVESYGGQLTAAANENSGASFEISIPMCGATTDV